MLKNTISYIDCQSTHSAVKLHFLTQLTWLRFFFGVNTLRRSNCSDSGRFKLQRHCAAKCCAAVRSRAISGRCRLVVGRRTPVHPLTRKQMVHMAPAPQGENLSAEPQLRSHCQSERSRQSGVRAGVGLRKQNGIS